MIKFILSLFCVLISSFVCVDEAKNDGLLFPPFVVETEPIYYGMLSWPVGYIDFMNHWNKDTIYIMFSPGIDSILAMEAFRVWQYPVAYAKEGKSIDVFVRIDYNLLLMDGAILGLTTIEGYLHTREILFATVRINPALGYSSRLRSVYIHEFGHVLGLDHCLTDSTRMMYPFIQTDIAAPTGDEIKSVCDFYQLN